jgi:hypothetical protein
MHASLTQSRRPADDKVANRPHWKTDRPLIHHPHRPLCRLGKVRNLPQDPRGSYSCASSRLESRRSLLSGEDCYHQLGCLIPHATGPPHTAWTMHGLDGTTAMLPLAISYPLVRPSRRDTGRQAHHLLPSQAMTAASVFHGVCGIFLIGCPRSLIYAAALQARNKRAASSASSIVASSMKNVVLGSGMPLSLALMIQSWT